MEHVDLKNVNTEDINMENANTENVATANVSTDDVDVESLSNLGQFYMSRYDEALTKFLNNETKDCEAICTELLLNPDLPLVMRTGLHAMLAHGTENAAWHAGQAAQCYEEVVRLRPEDPRHWLTLKCNGPLLDAAMEDEDDEKAVEMTETPATTAQALSELAGTAGQADLPGQHVKVLVATRSSLPAPATTPAHTSKTQSKKRTRTGSGDCTPEDDHRSLKQPKRDGFE